MVDSVFGYVDKQEGEHTDREENISRFMGESSDKTWGQSMTH